MEPEELPIYLRSVKLPELRKSNARLWAETALMPYIKVKSPNLKDIPAFNGIDTGPKGKRYAPVLKAVIQSLTSLARNEEKGQS